ncbi:MAG: hypothetical protein Q9209_004438 [Squamulea sp. 1 TL-2023]
MRSRTGWYAPASPHVALSKLPRLIKCFSSLTCRARKLKCDEQKPACGQCIRAEKACKPCDGVVFRHQQNASMNSAKDDSDQGRSLEGFYAYKDTFDHNNVWVEVPKALTFVHVLDPFAEPPNPESDEGLMESVIEAHLKESEAPSTATLYLPSEGSTLHQANSYHDDSFGYLHRIPVNEDATSAGSSSQPQTMSAVTIENLEFGVNSSAALSAASEVRLETFQDVPGMVQGSREPWRAQSRAGTETSHQTAFLLRHFSEVTGRWMDLFDQTTFFGSHVPVKSISNPLLKHAACAYAAKQLGRVNGTKAEFGGLCSRQAAIEHWDAANQQWALLAAQHYDHAISLLMEALQWDQNPLETRDSNPIDKRHYAPRTLDGMVEERRLRRRKFEYAQSTARSDDVLAATAILCEYESLDASTAAWTRHLSGTKTLLDVVEVGVMPLDLALVPGFSPVSSHKGKPSQARKAIFWNFARQDLFAAFIHECRTRLDTDDVSMWRDAGLLLDVNDLVISSNTTDFGLSEDYLMREDMLGNALIWLVSKMMNLICVSSGPGASSKAMHPDDTAHGSSNTSVTEESLSEKWQNLDHELETWFNGLPETFMPSAIIPITLHGAQFTEVWLSIPVCAATTITWHFSQILLLVNKPYNIFPRRRTTIANRVNSYRNIQSEITYHSRQILGLCLARPDASVRIHALHPLFVAGQCLTETAERRVVIDLLRGTEKDLGWATDYRVQQLHQEWGWQMEVHA